MKKDCVLDEDNNTISLAEYNFKHGTEYTLDDVYGKGYTDSLTDEEKADMPMPKVENFCGGVQVTIERTKFMQMTNVGGLVGDAEDD